MSTTTAAPPPAQTATEGTPDDTSSKEEQGQPGDTVASNRHRGLLTRYHGVEGRFYIFEGREIMELPDLKKE